MKRQFTLLAFAVLVCALPAEARTHRSTAAKHEFQRMTPCPSTGLQRGKCPGYVIDHIDPLCHCGADAPANMQWQTDADAKEKDKWERKLCRANISPAPGDAPCLIGPLGGPYRIINGRKRYGC